VSVGELTDRVAIVTGAARGQGAAAARRFVAEGARVVIADVLDDLGKEFADSLGGLAYYRHLDVSSEDDWTAVVDEVMTNFGRVDVLVNNAGILRFCPLPDMSLEDYMRIVNVNQVGTFLGMRTVAKPMIAAKRGSIVNISSVEGLAGMSMLTAYTGTKFAIRGMTKVAALELGPSGVRVNSVHPGMIETDMVKDAAGGHEVDLKPVADKRIPLRRLGQSDDVAELVLFLASDRSSYCTGGEFAVDGGATATHAFYMG
jgi:3alpha(or 20beta)-hydroxysteroid dehydrogenase